MDPVALAPLPDPGEPLADSVRRRLERLLGRSLADARLHDHTQAERLTRRLGAAAFTLGHHIYVRPGLARAAEQDGPALALLAHEATHIAQQAPASPADFAPPPGLPPRPSPTNHPRPLAHSPGPVIQRALDADAEGQALANEAAARAATAEAASPPAVDPADVADRVYRLLVRDLQNNPF